MAHEFNNRLGSILLNADFLAISCPGARDAATDIAKSTEALVDVTRGMEVLLGGVEPNPPLLSIQKLTERIAGAYLRQRRIVVRFAHVQEHVRIARNPASVFLAMLLSLVVFSRKTDGGPATISIAFSEEEGLSRKWRMDVDIPVERDEAAFGALRELCEAERWVISSGDGWLCVEAKAGA